MDFGDQMYIPVPVIISGRLDRLDPVGFCRQIHLMYYQCFAYLIHDGLSMVIKKERLLKLHNNR